MRRFVPDLLLLAVALVWGGSYLAAKGLVDAVGVEPALALRYAIAAVGMLVVVGARRAGAPDLHGALVGLGLGCSQAAILWLETAGVGQTSATNAGLLISLSLILTPLLEAALLRRRLPLPFYLAATVAIVGVGLLASPHGLRVPNFGDLLVLAAALVRAGHVAATARLLRPRDDVPTLVALQLGVGAVLFVLVSAPRLGAVLPGLGWSAFGSAVFLGIGCSVFAFVVQAWAVQRTSAARASLLMGTEPLWAALIGMTVGGEALVSVQFLGAALIVLGTLVGSELERRAREARSLGAVPHDDQWGRFLTPVSGES